MSARANALAIESPLDGPSLLRALNGISADIWFTATTTVAPAFRPRGATRRIYRYHESSRGRNLARTRTAARLLRGEVDVRSLARGLPAGTPARREIERVSIRVDREGWTIEVAAPRFVWGMVRKIVAALREVDAGRLALQDLRSALRGTCRLTLPLAEPEPLILWEVEYPFSWAVHWRGPNRLQSESSRIAQLGFRARGRLRADLEGGER